MIALGCFVVGFLAGLFVCGMHWIHRVRKLRALLDELVRVTSMQPRITALAESNAIKSVAEAVDSLLRWPA